MERRAPWRWGCWNTRHVLNVSSQKAQVLGCPEWVNNAFCWGHEALFPECLLKSSQSEGLHPATYQPTRVPRPELRQQSGVLSLTFHIKPKIISFLSMWKNSLNHPFKPKHDIRWASKWINTDKISDLQANRKGKGDPEIEVFGPQILPLYLEQFLKREVVSFPNHIKWSLKLFIVFVAQRHHSVSLPQAQPCVTILKNVKK